MNDPLERREFLKITAGSALCAGVPGLITRTGDEKKSGMASPGSRKSKVPVAVLYMGSSDGLWPKPGLNFDEEIAFYQKKFEGLKSELYDVEFVVNERVTSPEEVITLKPRLLKADGILAIHFNIGIGSVLQEILRTGMPVSVFAAPYSGHEWVSFGNIRNQPAGAKMECFLTSDYTQLARAVRPFRAIHHLREAKILNLTTRDFGEYAASVKAKFGTEIQKIELKRMEDAYRSVREKDAERETLLWIEGAEKVVEPARENIFKSCRLALAMEKIMDEEQATVLTIDCYGSMWDKTIKLPAYPCVGFTRLNNIGLGGICESDLRCAMTHILFQGLSGRPGFISDPTMDESKNVIILAHCLGTTRMDGPSGPEAPYKLRDVMERREGVVPQVQMRIGEKVTQALLIGVDQLPYFTGEIVDAPVGLEYDRGCRTKIAVKVDGCATRLWQNWNNGLHRQTCYGNIVPELSQFCRFKEIKMINEAV